MGIQGLLPRLEPITERCHISKYAGERVGVDASVWLHRGTYGCAIELFTRVPTTRHIQYCIRTISMLLHHRVIPVIVFDGGVLKAKSHTASKRKAVREEARAAALARKSEVDALAQELANAHAGRKAELKTQLAKARKAFEEACQRCVEVTAEDAALLIAELRVMGVEFVVAPYEADAQLAYLARAGSISAVLTEDSDLVAFGCPTILTKLNNCEVTELRTSRLTEIAEPFSLRGFSPEMFTQMCVFSGVDYLESPRNLGLGTARKLLAKHKTAELVIRALQDSKTIELPPDYAEKFAHALLTFSHQRVYDSSSGTLRPLTPLPAGLQLSTEQLDAIIGADLPPEVARGIAEGRLNPKSHLPFLRAPPPQPPRAQSRPPPREPARPSRPAGRGQPSRPKPLFAASTAARAPPPQVPPPEAEEGSDVEPADAEDLSPPPPPPPPLPLAPTLPAPVTPSPRAAARRKLPLPKPPPPSLADALGSSPPLLAPAEAGHEPPGTRRRAVNPFSCESQFDTARPGSSSFSRTIGQSLAGVAIKLTGKLGGMGAALTPSPRLARSQRSPPLPLPSSPQQHATREESAADAAAAEAADAAAAEAADAAAAEAASRERESAAHRVEEPELPRAVQGATPLAVPSAEPSGRPEGLRCAHCRFENASSRHVCVACDRLLAPTRGSYGTPRARAAAVGEKRKAPAHERARGAASAKATKFRTPGKGLCALPNSGAQRMIHGYFARGT